MKYIVKGSEPIEFTDCKNQANEDWQPSYDILSGLEKSALVNALLKEQGFLCCYCEVRIDRNNSHIEHIKPQSIYKEEALNYSNMLSSCLNETKKGEPLHCGRKKGNWFDEVLLVSPLDPGCEERFGFLGDGEIFAQDDNDAGACETIKRLGLNIPKLKSLRKSAIDTFIEIIEDESHDTDFPAIFVSAYSSRDGEGRFGEFCTTIKYIYEKYGAI